MKNPKTWIEDVLQSNGTEYNPGDQDHLGSVGHVSLDIDRRMRELRASLDSQEVNSLGPRMVESFGVHINPGFFSRILHRRGSSNRILVPLADRTIEDEGWGKLYLNQSLLQSNMVPLLTIDLMSKLTWLDKSERVSKHMLDASQDAMQKHLDNMRQMLVRNAEEALEQFRADMLARLNDSSDRR